MNKWVTTLSIVLSKDNKRILLGMKKRGFGAKRWNGFGGKVDKAESIEQCARRELLEEAKIRALGIKKRGIITFFEADPLPIEVHIFSCTQFEGKPQETEEMKPKWFKLEEIPYSDMWPDDKYWLPMLLDGKNFEGEFRFKDENNTNIITDYKLLEATRFKTG